MESAYHQRHVCPADDRGRAGRFSSGLCRSGSEMSLRSSRSNLERPAQDGLVGTNTENKMSNFWTYKSKSKKVKMNYSRCHIY